MPSPRILVVDDEEIMRVSLTSWLAEDGYEVHAVADGHAALQAIQMSYWDVLLVDLKMPEMDGLELLRKVKQFDENLPVIIITAYATVDTAVIAMKEGAYDYIVKPFDPEEIGLTIKKILEHRQLVKENLFLKKELTKQYHFYDIIGKSRCMQEVFELIRVIAPTDSNILIYGESGTGKEMTARAIHNASHRRNGPFVSLSCGALPESLLEAELFGYEKGAFTGAVTRHIGKFELACGGTLLLDEIGDINPKTQIDLLRVIEERQIRRLGGNDLVDVDIRLITATNKNLKEEIAAGRFREDLYYRLNVITVHLPPLKERKEDIPLLVEHFIEKFSIRNSKKIKGISAKAMQALMQYSWPGNVRQLANVIERAVILVAGDTIDTTELPKDIYEKEVPVGRTLEAVEKRHLQVILEEVGWNIQQAAKILGIHRATLYKKIEKYGLHPKSKL